MLTVEYYLRLIEGISPKLLLLLQVHGTEPTLISICGKMKTQVHVFSKPVTLNNKQPPHSKQSRLHGSRLQQSNFEKVYISCQFVEERNNISQHI